MESIIRLAVLCLVFSICLGCASDRESFPVSRRTSVPASLPSKTELTTQNQPLGDGYVESQSARGLDAAVDPFETQAPVPQGQEIDSKPTPQQAELPPVPTPEPVQTQVDAIESVESESSCLGINWISFEAEADGINVSDGAIDGTEYWESHAMAFEVQGSTPSIFSFGKNLGPIAAFQGFSGFFNDILPDQNVGSRFLSPHNVITNFLRTLTVRFAYPMGFASLDIIDPENGEVFSVQGYDETDTLVVSEVLRGEDRWDGMTRTVSLSDPSTSMMYYTVSAPNKGGFGTGFDNFKAQGCESH